VCSPNVVAQFARVAHAVGFLYCYSILEANRRAARAPAEADGPGKLAPGAAGPDAPALAELNTFFPFDPYALPRSAAYIDGVYRDWASVAIGVEGGEDEDEDDASGDEDEDGDGEAPGTEEDGASDSDSSGRPRTPLDEVVSASFGGMSISPARPRAMA
jgi:RNA polymerase I-specific transcription initiation factor RRN3